MHVSDLEQRGIAKRVLDTWRKRQGEVLLPVQRRAIERGLLGSGGGDRPVSMVICAPTSSGKSFCAELAAVRALMARRKAVLLLPLKSLAEEKYRLLEDTYGPLGVKCLIVTGDHPENDGRFLRGDYHLAVAIYEKFDMLLTANLDALKNIGVLVTDELQMIAESRRGAILERLLTRVMASTYHPSLVALSAVIGPAAAQPLAAWLNAEVVEETARPVELQRGVATAGSYRYRSYNSGQDGQEPFADFDCDGSPVEGFLRQLREGDGSTLVFMKSRQDTVNLAFKLASAVGWPSATKALERLRGEESSYLVRSLCQALGRGVAFHNADLSIEQRRIVEQAFVLGEVRVVFSTTTLAMGVNLPADTVYLETVKYGSVAYDGRPSLVPISRAEFDNMTGRAGRLGLADDRPGRAVVLAESDFDRDILWRQYIASAETVPIESAFDSLPLVDWLLSMIVCGLVRNPAQALQVYGCTYRVRVEPDVRPDFDAAVESLVSLGLVDRSDSGELTSTTMGRAAAGAGLQVVEVAHYARALNGGYPESDFGWTALGLSSPGMVFPPGMVNRMELAENLVLKQLYGRFDSSVGEIRWLLPEDHRRQPLAYRQAVALKALLLLDDWAVLTPVQRLEEQYQMHLGQIISLGEAVGHQLTALAAMVEASDCEAPTVVRLRDRAFSLRRGLPVEMRELYLRFGDVLGRSDFAALRRAGITSPIEVIEGSDSELREILGDECKCMAISEKCQSVKQEVEMSVREKDGGAMAVVEPELVEIDGTFDRERYLVRINGFDVRLTGKSFKYFTKLALSRMRRNSGWIYKEDIEVGFNQARYLYRMKNEIKAGLNSLWPIVENNRLGYYRLDIVPERIRINTENLKNHPDYEIRTLVNGEAVTSGQSAVVN